MPYYIRDDAEGCKGKWAVVSDKGNVHGCHSTKKAAIDQAVAIKLATGEEYMGDWKNKDKRN